MSGQESAMNGWKFSTIGAANVFFRENRLFKCFSIQANCAAIEMKISAVR